VLPPLCFLVIKKGLIVKSDPADILGIPPFAIMQKRRPLSVGGVLASLFVCGGIAAQRFFCCIP